MTKEQLEKGKELLDREYIIKGEISSLDEQYNWAVINKKGVSITFDQRTTYTPNKNQFQFRDTMYKVLREELEKELIEIQKEFETL